jgi:hypothetical protein
VGPSACPNTVEKRNVSFPLLGIEPRFPGRTARSVVTILAELSRPCSVYAFDTITAAGLHVAESVRHQIFTKDYPSFKKHEMDIKLLEAIPPPCLLPS